MRNIKFVSLLAVLGFTYSFVLAGNLVQRDSLIALLPKMPNDSTKADLYFEIANNYEESLIFAYQFADTSLQLSLKIGYKKGIVRSYVLMGNIKRAQGEYPTALNYLLEALNLIHEVTDSWLKTRVYNGLANNYYFQGPEYFGKAIDYNLKAIEIQQEIKDSLGLARSYSSLGTLYSDPISQATIDHEKSLEYFTKALDLAEKIGEKEIQASMLGSIGFLYKEKHEYEDALLFMNQSLELSREMGNKWGEMSANYRLGMLNQDQGNYKKSIYFFEQALKLAVEFNNKDLANNAHEGISKTYLMTGNYKGAFDHYYQAVELKFELYNKERIDRVAEYQTKYEMVQKQKEIEILKREAELKEIRIKKQQLVSLSIVGGVVLLILVIALLYRSNRLKQKANEALRQKNEEISKQKEEIESQKDEIETQRDMVLSQKELIENVHDKLTDSLRYAQSIQAAILPSEKFIQQISSESFVLMKPCEVISGDFFWAAVFDEYQVFCVSDCTGHGVPGAFMSILGITALNDIVTRHRVKKANEILGFLRASVIEALSQNDPNHLHKDGMEIALCILNTKTNELQFAGAGIPLWIVTQSSTSNIEINARNEPFSRNDFTLHELKGDIMPVGNSPRMEPFTNQTIKLNGARASIYLCTDGYADQLGGQSKTKFGVSKLKSLILDNAAKDFSAQKQILEDTFIYWQGINYQVDDVAILGIRL